MKSILSVILAVTVLAADTEQFNFSKYFRRPWRNNRRNDMSPNRDNVFRPNKRPKPILKPSPIIEESPPIIVNRVSSQE